MTLYLNTNVAYKDFQMLRNDSERKSKNKESFSVYYKASSFWKDFGAEYVGGVLWKGISGGRTVLRTEDQRKSGFYHTFQ